MAQERDSGIEQATQDIVTQRIRAQKAAVTARVPSPGREKSFSTITEELMAETKIRPDTLSKGKNGLLEQAPVHFKPCRAYDSLPEGGRPR